MRIARDDIELLWSTDYWDGPLAGVCRYREEEYYFLMHSDREWFLDADSEDSDNVDDWDDGFYIPRIFLVYPMTEEDKQDEFYWHEEFLKYVKSGEYTREQYMELYYDPYFKHRKENPRDYTERDDTSLRPIGYFLESES